MVMKRVQGSSRITFSGAGLLLAALTIAGCGGGSPATQPTGTDDVSSVAPNGVVAADPSWGHIHNLSLEGDVLKLGTHEGLWEQAPGETARLMSDPPFDVMGLAVDGERLIASGHPGEGQDLPTNLGLVESTDGGSTWSPVSLEGDVDFHRLSMSGDMVLGQSSHDGRLLRSNDGGVTWIDLGTPELFDVAVDPDGSDQVLGTSERGPVVSDDGGATFTQVADAPLLSLVTWTPKRLYGVSPDGLVHISADDGMTWRTGAQLNGTPAALAADGKHVVVLVGESIVESIDEGSTFTPRISGIEGH